MNPHDLRAPVLLAATAFLLCAPATANAATFGNYDDLGGNSSNAPGFLIGQTIPLAGPTRVDAVGILFRTTGYQAHVGIFADDEGLPGAMIAETDVFSVDSAGRLEVPLPASIVLDPGDYWFMAAYSAVASTGISRSSESFFAGRGIFGFGDSLEGAFEAPGVHIFTYDGGDLNYYLIGETVPEPSTALLIGLGLASMACRRGSRSLPSSCARDHPMRRG